MDFKEEEEVVEKLIPERDKLGYRHTFAFDSLLGMPMFAAVFVLMFAMVAVSMAGLPDEVQNNISMGLLIVYVLAGAASFVLWIYAAYIKAHTGQGKTIVKTHLLFMEPNTTSVSGGYEHTLVIETQPQVSAAAPVKELVEDVLPELKEETFQKIMENIEARLPELDGKKYKIVRYHFPDSPFPDLVLKDGRLIKGDKGTYINKTILMVVHEDFTEPTEAFDYSPDNCTTFYANYESEQPCHLGTICLWEFYQLTQEWVCTPGILPEHRQTRKQVRPSDKEREYVELVELLRLIPTTAGASIRAKATLESLQELVKQGQIGRAVDTGIDAMNPGFKKSNFFKDMWDKYNFWIIILLIVSILGAIWIFTGGAPGG